MIPTYQKQHAALLKQILAALPVSAKAEERRFVEECYAKMLVADLEKLEPAKAVAIARSMFAFMQSRTPGEPKIRLFSPSETEHGYSGSMQVIELLNDDMPFLVDSLTAELTRQGLNIRETIHPIISAQRDAKGNLKALGEGNEESLIHFEISPLPDDLTPEQLIHDLEWVLTHIRAAVQDWKTIVEKAEEHIISLKKTPKFIDAAMASEVRDFMSWLVDRNFVFLGYAEYDFVSDANEGHLAIVGASKLGILKIIDEQSPTGLESMPEEQRHRLLNRQLIEITKSNRRSPVHRFVPMDYVAIKRFDEKGNVVGEARFLGLFTSNVYYQSASSIPLVRVKIASVYTHSGFLPVSHDGKSLGAILEFLPRDEIFQMSEEELFETSMGILALEAKPGVRIFARKDAFERFVSAMVFVPKERFSTELRKRIQEIMERAYNGVITSFTTQIADAPLARLHLIIKTTPGDIPAVELSKVEKDIERMANMWSDHLLEALLAKHDEQKAHRLHRHYETAFPQSYINRYDAIAAAYDIDRAEAALSGDMLELELYQLKNDANIVHLKIYNPNEEIALSDILPLLENSGFRAIEEQPFQIKPQAVEGRVWIRDFKLAIPAHIADIAPLKAKLESSLLSAWNGASEQDRFNTLVLNAGLEWREVAIIRAYAKYLKQIGFNASQPTIEQAFNANPAIARQIVDLFHARFSLNVPQRDVKQHAQKAAIEAARANVASATEDRILHRYVDIIEATVRTNYYQTNRPILSFKLDSQKVPELPLPKPYVEIFVYSPRVEGIHLRGGKVARGGLRWSDRADDFRTEVLGLMKAQMVKNSVIVPVGSKGGFVLKKSPANPSREALQEEGIACYKLYLQGLLDITDNLLAGAVVPPQNVVRHDEDDPYLVVAADKGTASFSDIANGISHDYGFWLGDAFASGGSVGYDHKKMGITARGGWVSVSRHFREMGKDVASENFTCAGIGDMAGDVFGNGMLMSKHTLLVAAFNHQHIFLDPAPDAAKSFDERARLFALPRSSWKDYDATLLSKGGGIYERSAKTITISPEARALLGVEKDSFTPDELIRAILQAKVDLLWNGGIGTYVKSEDESHENVGDRANNALRINGKELRCKVVGEGGNLGFTQRGRIEYARMGGRINTDAIDNSAGVDCSDHEVNIKIAFSGEMSKGKLTIEKRDSVLESMTDEVAELVLKDNVLQTLALTVSEQMGVKWLEPQTRLIHALEKKNLLNRNIEFLPTDKALQELKVAGKGLTRPELAVLLAYSKMDMYNALITTDVMEHDYFADELKRYFPRAMQSAYADAISAHPLKREIIATVLTNSLVNRVGMNFVNDLAEETGASVSDIAVCYALVRDGFSLRMWWGAIDALTGVISANLQAELFASTQQLVVRLVRWLLRYAPQPLSIEEVKRTIIDPASAMLATLGQQGLNAQEVARLSALNVPESLAQFMGSLEHVASLFDMIQIARESELPTSTISPLYNRLGDRLGLARLRALATSIPTNSYWDRAAIQGLVSDLYQEQRRLTTLIAKAQPLSVEAWLAKNAEILARYDQLMADLSTGEAIDVPKLIVALTHVKIVG